MCASLSANGQAARPIGVANRGSTLSERRYCAPCCATARASRNLRIEIVAISPASDDAHNSCRYSSPRDGEGKVRTWVSSRGKNRATRSALSGNHTVLHDQRRFRIALLFNGERRRTRWIARYWNTLRQKITGSYAIENGTKFRV